MIGINRDGLALIEMTLEVCPFNDLSLGAKALYSEYSEGGYHCSPDVLSCAELLGRGIVWVAFFECDEGTLFHIFHKCVIAPEFGGGEYCDLISPYDFGTYITNPIIDENKYSTIIKKFYEKFSSWCADNGVVCEFIRFNPMRHRRAPETINDIFIQDNHVVDISSGYESAHNAYSAKNRQKLRTAERRGAHAEVANSPEGLENDFHRLYSMTMERLGAEPFMRFPLEYFRKLFATHRVVVSTARASGSTIAAMGVFQIEKETAYYFLSGSDRAYRDVHPNNIMLDAAIKWAAENGITSVHLGGGSYASLNEFKKGFANSSAPYYVSRNIFLPHVYEELAGKWIDLNPGVENKNFPIYRTQSRRSTR